MKKKVRIAIAMIMVLLLFSSNITIASAATITPITSKRTIISEGYTEDGIHYTVYLVNKYYNSDITPNIVVSKYLTFDVQFDGNVRPPDKWSISVYDYDYKTTMTGSLTLQYWYAENFFGWTTYATYSGYVFGHI